MSIISTNNVASVYSYYYQGLELDRGFEKIGWVRADLQMQLIASKNVPVISNYDMKNEHSYLFSVSTRVDSVSRSIHKKLSINHRI